MPDGDVVATVGDGVITVEQLEARLALTGGSAAAGVDAVLDRLVAERAALALAAERGALADPTYRARLEAIEARADAERAAAARAWLRERIDRSAPIDEKALRAAYERDKERFLTTRYHVQQISLPDRVRAEAVLAAVEGGRSFGEAMTQIAAAGRGEESVRDYGAVEHTAVPPALRATVFAMDGAGEVAGPVEAGGRWHLVHLAGVERVVPRAFAAVRSQLEAEYRDEQARLAFADLLDRQRGHISVTIAEDVLATHFAEPAAGAQRFEVALPPEVARREEPADGGSGH